jgi:hypothetical protein
MLLIFFTAVSLLAVSSELPAHLHGELLRSPAWHFEVRQPVLGTPVTHHLKLRVGDHRIVLKLEKAVVLIPGIFHRNDSYERQNLLRSL